MLSHSCQLTRKAAEVKFSVFVWHHVVIFFWLLLILLVCAFAMFLLIILACMHLNVTRLSLLMLMDILLLIIPLHVLLIIACVVALSDVLSSLHLARQRHFFHVVRSGDNLSSRLGYTLQRRHLLVKLTPDLVILLVLGAFMFLQVL
jgi:hypothetical protein